MSAFVALGADCPSPISVDFFRKMKRAMKRNIVCTQNGVKMATFAQNGINYGQSASKQFGVCKIRDLS